MAFIEWNETFRTNIRSCDEQHQCLVKLINELHEAMKGGKGKEVIARTLSELVDYTSYHFKTEEELFQKHGYPEALIHHKEHHRLSQQATELKAKVDSGQSVITIEVMNFLKNWLNDHILKVDKKYGPFLNSRGVY